MEAMMEWSHPTRGVTTPKVTKLTSAVATDKGQSQATRPCVLKGFESKPFQEMSFCRGLLNDHEVRKLSVKHRQSQQLAQ
eukprot:6479365-Amphidinium_carterae.1